MAKGTVNKVILLGRLGQDPEVRATAGGTQVVNLNVATTELGGKDQNGQRQEQTEWHRCTVWGRTAEIAAQYLRKGSQVYLEGRLQTRKWQDQNGNDRYSTEIVAHEMQLMGGKDDSRQQQAQQPMQQPQQRSAYNPDGTPMNPQQYQQQANNQPSAPQVVMPPSVQHGPGFDDFDDEIPF